MGENKQDIDLMHTIQIKFPRLSKGQKLIAEYILKHYDKAAFMTAAKLGTSVGVSESTVVRLQMNWDLVAILNYKRLCRT